MRFVSNAGSDRVLDLIRPWIQRGHQIDMVSPAFSLFAYSELLDELPPGFPSPLRFAAATGIFAGRYGRHARLARFCG